MIYHLHDWPWNHLMFNCILIWPVFVNWSLIFVPQYSSPKTQANHGRILKVFPLVSHTWFVCFTEPLLLDGKSNVMCILKYSIKFIWMIEGNFIICLRIKLRSDFSLSCPPAFEIWFSPHPGKYWNISKRKQLGDISQECNLIIQYKNTSTSFIDLYIWL